MDFWACFLYLVRALVVGSMGRETSLLLSLSGVQDRRDRELTENEITIGKPFFQACVSQ